MAALADEVEALPDLAGVFVLRMGPAEPYVGRTKHLRSRVERLLSESEGKRLSLAGRVTGIEWTPVYSDFEARLTQYEVLRREFPNSYRRKLRLRTPPVLRIGWSNPYPRASVTRKVGRSSASTYYGPFRSRKDAEETLHALLANFQVRRCWEDLQPSAEHPGCVYGEMKMCGAPCQLKVASEGYAYEVRRFEAFLASGGASELDRIASEREHATEALEFERAAKLHEEWQKWRASVSSLPESVRRVERWDGVILQKGSGPDAVRVFSVRGGDLRYAGEAVFATEEKGLRQVADRLLALLVAEAQASAPKEMWSERFALLAKWLYRNPAKREGELVQADRDGVVSSRKLANAGLRILNSDSGVPATVEYPSS